MHWPGGVTTADVMATVAQVAATGAPTMVMSYWNPIERYGVARFAAELAEAGGCGVITADITPDEAGAWIEASSTAQLSTDLPGRSVLDRRADRADHRRVLRLRLRRRGDGGHRRA